MKMGLQLLKLQELKQIMSLKEKYLETLKVSPPV
jgi:hypothetical protein